MIRYSKHKLPNGLTVILHVDKDTPMAVINTLYNVGSKDEDENKTGFAHLFEHLMFGGSKNIARFDDPLQLVGGDNNAFTSTDITNYYVTLPSQNIETAFWLESDRMAELSFDPHVLEVQRKVVIEEFKQRYLNQPYGDVWLKLRPLAYKKHPYRWPTIGKEIKHIEDAEMQDVKNFFYNFYSPNNATLVVAGNIDENRVLEMVNDWYGEIPVRPKKQKTIEKEPLQSEYRFEKVTAKVPVDALYMTFHIPGKGEKEYYDVDLLSDLLGRGHSSRLYDQLVKKKKIFSSLSSHTSGSHDPGLLMISGKLNPNIDITDAENHIWEILENVKTKPIEDYEVEKVKNQAESSVVYSETELLNRAMNLAISTNLGDTDLINKEIEYIRAVNNDNLVFHAKKVLNRENCSVIHYLSDN